MEANEFGIDKLGRPCKDLYCMNLCFEIARKSLDPSTKHGCLAIDEDGIILSAGYNSPPQDSKDEEVPLTRPEKYLYFEHSERNCIYLASRKQVSLKNSVFYITGFHCTDCVRGMMEAKVRKIIYGTYNSIMTDSEEYLNKYKKFIKICSIIISRFKYDEGLYRFNPRIRKIVEEKEVSNIDFEWNGWQDK